MYTAILFLLLIPGYQSNKSVPGCKQDLAKLICDGRIPTDVPEMINYVFIDNLVNTSMNEIQIHSDRFKGENWEDIKRLDISSQLPTTLKANAFKYLKSLEYLGTQWIPMLSIEKNVFVGLSNVHTLDFVYARQLTLDKLVTALNGSEIVPRLSTLLLIDIDLGNSLNLSRPILEVLASKPITAIDLSRATINEIDFPAMMELLCNRPLHLTCTKCSFTYTKLTYSKCESLKHLDLRYAFTVYEIPKPIPQNVVINVGSFLQMYEFFIHIDTIVADNIYIGITPFPGLRNITFHSLEKDTSTLRSLSLAHANIRYLDIKFINVLSSLERLNLSSNNMVYIQPKLLPENNTLLSLDLSNNDLQTMLRQNFSDFQNLVLFYKKLQILNMSGNQLSFIPAYMFVANLHLRTLDLSCNKLKEISFILKGTLQLHLLNMRSNNVTRLSRLSMEIIQNVFSSNKSFRIDLRDNFILCNSCESRVLIEWLLSGIRAVRANTCQDYKGNLVPINNIVLSDVVYICNDGYRRIVGIVVSLTVTVSSLLTIAVVIKCVKRKLRQTKHKRMIKSMQEGRHKFEFVAFVASSGEDEYFVEKIIIEPLKKCLRSIIHTNKELVCTGDRHFRLGCTIADQTEVCCKKSGAVILVLSKSFCKSPYCNNEMHIAYTMRKPIILMFKERVEQCDMTPLLRVIFKQYTRVTWKIENGTYKMSTSWENICKSLLDSGQGLTIV